MEIFEVRFEIYHNDKLIQEQSMTAPQKMIIMQFLNLAKQIKNISDKMKVKLIRPELIYIPWENQHKILENCIEIQNYEE